MKQIFVVPINPQGWNTPPFSIGRRGGKPIVIPGRDEENHAFKEAVKEELIAQQGFIIPGPYDIRLAIWRKVEKGRKPVDLTNMQKLIEDALQGVVIDNDAQTISFKTEVVEQSANAPEFFVLLVDHCQPIDRGDEDIILGELFGDSDYELQRTIKPLLAGKTQRTPTRDNVWPPV